MVWCWQKATSYWKNAIRKQNLLGGVPAGPQMLEALNVGSIDLGSTGDIPPIFAQAAGADLVYVGVEPPKPKAEVILVAENSPIKTVADLKGHKVAFQKGSSSHNLYCEPFARPGLNSRIFSPLT